MSLNAQTGYGGHHAYSPPAVAGYRGGTSQHRGFEEDYQTGRVIEMEEEHQDQVVCLCLSNAPFQWLFLASQGQEIGLLTFTIRQSQQGQGQSPYQTCQLCEEAPTQANTEAGLFFLGNV